MSSLGFGGFGGLRHYRRYSHWIVRIVAALAMLASPPSAANENSCVTERPLFEASWAELIPANQAGPAGEWRLPLSPERPEVITEARMALSFDWIQDASGYQAMVKLSFPDPKPFGLPFTFQKVELSWVDSAGPHSTTVDWSESCSGPGRSLFPGNQWFSPLGEPLPGSTPLVQARLRIWGSRN